MSVTLDLDLQCDEQIDHFTEQADKNLTMDLEEQDGSIDGESDNLNTEGTMEQYYSRMLKPVTKTEYSPKAVFSARNFN